MFRPHKLWILLLVYPTKPFPCTVLMVVVVAIVVIIVVARCILAIIVAFVARCAVTIVVVVVVRRYRCFVVISRHAVTHCAAAIVIIIVVAIVARRCRCRHPLHRRHHCSLSRRHHWTSCRCRPPPLLLPLSISHRPSCCCHCCCGCCRLMSGEMGGWEKRNKHGT